MENTDFQNVNQSDSVAKNTIEHKETQKHNVMDVPSPLPKYLKITIFEVVIQLKFYFSWLLDFL